MKKILAIAILTTVVFTSCKESLKQEKQEVTNTEVSKSKKENVTNLLVGSWIQPNPISNKEVQGFTLKNDGSAESINMATLVYKKWWAENGKLNLVAESIGNGSSSTDTTQYEILKNTDQILELKNGDYTDKYKKQ